MNDCNKKFIEKNSIDISQIDENIYDGRSVNEIISKYEIQGESINEDVSVENMIGIYSISNSIPRFFPYALDSFFCEGGDGYHSRAISMLEYDDVNVINGLQRSFREEPMGLIEFDTNKYLVFTNGMHRFMVMRLLYLSAKCRCNSDEEKDELQKRYTIPVKTTKIDFIKTYCKYLINMFQPISCMDEFYTKVEKTTNFKGEEMYCLHKYIHFDQTKQIYETSERMEQYLNSYVHLGNEYDSNYSKTGRSVLKNFKGESTILSDEELILFTKNMILKSNRFTANAIDQLKEQTLKYKSFNEFMQSYFKDILDFNFTMEGEKDGNIKK